MNPIERAKQIIAGISSDNIAKYYDENVSRLIRMRRRHEVMWYEHNFFDDGYHFKLISKKTGRIIDHAPQGQFGTERAIPRASRQIRGVSNLLFSAEPFPVAYPERVNKYEYESVDKYLQQFQKAKDEAKKKGIWLTTEWENMSLPVSLINMILKTSKHGVSYIQIYSDTDKQKILSDIYDAFDIVLDGDKESIYQSPFIDKVRSRKLEEIKSDPMYEAVNTKKLSPDNRYASSDLKQAYMESTYGSKTDDDPKRGSILEHETFAKETLTDDNWKKVMKFADDSNVMEGKSKGDMVMRHTFWCAGVGLKDEYVDYDEYPYVDLRFEPGTIYQKPFIKNFIDQNKSLDIVMSRLEAWVNAMVVGVYSKRKGENYTISNAIGAQYIEYETTPPQQMQNTSVGATPFNVISLLDKYIEEQGATTSALGAIPSGVKANAAIENIKASEYANLKIPTMMLKDTIKRIAERMLERADKDFLKPMEVSHIEDGNTQYFDVMGQRGYQLSQKLNVQLPENIVVLNKKTKVRIEIEAGLGFTMEGKRQAMTEIINMLTKFTELGAIPKEALNIAIKKFLESYGFGSTEEFMDAIEEGMLNQDMGENQIQQMKIAVAEVLKDSGAVGPEADQKMVDSTKVGVVEAMRDMGMVQKNKQDQGQNKVSINYKDLPPDGQIQAAANAGIQISQNAAKEKDKLQNTSNKMI